MGTFNEGDFDAFFRAIFCCNSLQDKDLNSGLIQLFNTVVGGKRASAFLDFPKF